MKLKELFEEVFKYDVNINDKDIKDGYFKEHEWSDKELNGIFNVVSTDGIKTLKNSPKIVNEFTCSGCTDLSSLVGGPEEVRVFCDFDFCTKLSSMEGAPKIIGSSITLEKTSIKSFEGIGRDYLTTVRDTIWFPQSLESNVLGLMKVQGLKKIQALQFELTNTLRYPAQSAMARIINKHLKSGKNINKCKSELKEAGLEEYAQL